MRIFSLILISSVLLFLGCNSDEIEEHTIGSNLIEKTSNVTLIDTFTIESSTVILDSVVTSGYTTAILGSYTDEYLGRIKSDLYGVVSLNGAFRRNTISSDNNDKVPVKFDSLVFIIYPSGVHFGDTLQAQRIILNRITEELELPDNEFAFYAHNEFNYEEMPLLDEEFYLKPIKQSEFDEAVDAVSTEYDGEGLYFRLLNNNAIALGEDIIAHVNAESDTITETTHWLKYFNGLVVRSGDNNTALFNVDLNENKIKLRLYYSDTSYGEKGIAKFHDFPIVTGLEDKRSYLNYSSDRSETPQGLDRLVNREEELSSDETDGLCYIQGGVGLYIKINIPYIESLNTSGLTGGVLSAELLIHPKKNSFDDGINPLPFARIGLTETNEYNKFGLPLAGSNNSDLVFSYVPNYINEDESYYTADLTGYVNNLLLNGKELDEAILIGLPRETIGNSFERIIIENDVDSDFRIKLEVTYIVQQQ